MKKGKDWILGNMGNMESVSVEQWPSLEWKIENQECRLFYQTSCFHVYIKSIQWIIPVYYRVRY